MNDYLKDSIIWEAYNPIEDYEKTYKVSINENTEKFFDKLIEKVNVDRELNKEICKKVKKLESDLKTNKTSKNGHMAGMIIFIVLGVLLCLIGIFNISNLTIIIPFVVLGIVSIVLSLGCFLFFFLKYKKIVNTLESKLSKEKEKGRMQLQPLTMEMKHGIREHIIELSVPIIKFNKYLSNEKFAEFVSKNEDILNITDNIETSHIQLQSGKLMHYPFYIGRTLNHEMGTKIYTGTLPVTYTTWTTDSQGNSRRVTHTQILTASIEKPCPYYSKKTYIAYVNDAAPKLSFTRTYDHVEKLNPKKLEKFIKNKKKEFAKLTEQATKEGKNFTSLGNDKFEALWNCTNRDNEVEYRLMFTPLAQQKLTEILLDNKIGFGDNFEFKKFKKLNIIKSDELNQIDFRYDKSLYEHFYNLEDFKNTFLNNNVLFFKIFFLSMLPIMSIPLYLNQIPEDVIWQKHQTDPILSQPEQETLINQIGTNTDILPDLIATPAIFKTWHLKTEDNIDKLGVLSWGYKITPQIDYVRMQANDGVWYNVPVKWDRYDVVSKTALVNVGTYDKYEYENEYIDCIKERISSRSFVFDKKSTLMDVEAVDVLKDPWDVINRYDLSRTYDKK
ncbi:MAG1210 family protein [Mycoplasmopsis felifaucium]|uniref:Uncharacterized protein n=1 Tax=Mycoplasmopsis felifaucium TaxID=35768 RepID=A0ABZ2RXT4_9BACT